MTQNDTMVPLGQREVARNLNVGQRNHRVSVGVSDCAGVGRLRETRAAPNIENKTILSLPQREWRARQRQIESKFRESEL